MKYKVGQVLAVGELAVSGPSYYADGKIDNMEEYIDKYHSAQKSQWDGLNAGDEILITYVNTKDPKVAILAYAIKRNITFGTNTNVLDQYTYPVYRNTPKIWRQINT